MFHIQLPAFSNRLPTIDHGQLTTDKRRIMFTLIFPTYNPGSAIERTIAETSAFLRRHSEWEALFVCDGCTDGSAHVLQDFARRGSSRVRVLVHAPNRGKGYAVRRGFAEARGRWVIFADVDLAYGFEDIGRMAETLRGGADVAIASRFHPNSRLIMPAGLQAYLFGRHLQSLAFSTMVRLLLPVQHTDTQAGLKGMTARAAAQVLPYLQCDGFAFDCELLAFCSRLGLSVTEVPVQVRYENAKSTTGLTTIAAMFRALWTIRRHCRRLTPAPMHTESIALQPERLAA